MSGVIVSSGELDRASTDDEESGIGLLVNESLASVQIGSGGAELVVVTSLTNEVVSGSNVAGRSCDGSMAGCKEGELPDGDDDHQKPREVGIGLQYAFRTRGRGR